MKGPQAHEITSDSHRQRLKGIAVGGRQCLRLTAVLALGCEEVGMGHWLRLRRTVRRLRHMRLCMLLLLLVLGHNALLLGLLLGMLLGLVLWLVVVGRAALRQTSNLAKIQRMTHISKAMSADRHRH